MEVVKLPGLTVGFDLAGRSLTEAFVLTQGCTAPLVLSFQLLFQFGTWDSFKFFLIRHFSHQVVITWDPGFL